MEIILFFGKIYGSLSFKIDLIVWKSIASSVTDLPATGFKIDLIVWKLLLFR